MAASRSRSTDPLLTTRRNVLLAMVSVIGAPATASAARADAPPPLHAAGRYLATPDGKAVYLAGSHTWTNGQDIGSAPFDFEAYLDFLASKTMNLIRLWEWEAATDGGGSFGAVSPLRYARASDGRFDLKRFKQPYFDRIRARVIAAGARNIYVSIMLFNGTSVASGGSANNPWLSHPFNRNNNVNRINGDPHDTGSGLQVHTLNIPAIWTIQRAYLRKIVSTVSDLPNVLWEVANECQDSSDCWAWQNAVVDHVKQQEAAGGGIQHPVGITAAYPPAISCTEVNQKLLSSHADWVSLSGTDGAYYAGRQPRAPGIKPVLLDTDHIYGDGGDRTWVWTSVMQGYSTIYMDDLSGTGIAGLLIPGPTGNQSTEQSARTAMSQARRLVSRMDFTGMMPSGSECSTGYCLANPSTGEYLVFAENGGTVAVDLSYASGGTPQAEWLDLGTGQLSKISARPSTTSIHTFGAPHRAGVLIIGPGQRRG